MDNTHIYAVVAAGLVLCLLLRRGWPSVASHLASLYFRVSKFLAYRYVLRRHALIGPWTAITVLAELIYLAVNIVCLALGAADWSQIGQRAGTLSVIHLGLLLGGLHLSFLASLLGLSLGTVRAIHRSAGVMTLGLVGGHIVVCAAADKPGFQREALSPFGITVRERPVNASPMLICSRPLRHCYSVKVKLIYPARPATKPRPLIVLWHGGAFRSGSCNAMTEPGRTFAERFNAVVALGSYRMVPEVQWPVPWRDGWDLLAYLSRHAREREFGQAELASADGGGFVVGGISAGATRSKHLYHPAVCQLPGSEQEARLRTGST